MKIYEKANRNDEWGIKHYGEEEWNRRCDYVDNKHERQEKVLNEVIKPENMEKLFDKIREYVKLPNLKFTYRIETTRSGEYCIAFESEDLAKDNFLISLAWKDFRITQFNSSIGCSEPYYDKDYSKPVERVYYYIGIDYSYKHNDGGSNGAEIARAVFNENLEWEFLPAKRR